jgi:2,5-diketo-D-gluconate reductase A
VTTKFNRRWHGEREVRETFANSADRLGLERIDLLLIHWPNPRHDRYVDAWRGMLQLLEEGRLRAAGLSNFKPAHLERPIAETGVAPHVNQIELSPYSSRAEERRFHEAHGIVTESWSPIGQGGALLRDRTIGEIGDAHGRTPAQIVLRWHLQMGLVAIPKTSRPERLAENLDVFDFELSNEEMDRLVALDGRERVTDSDRYGH